MPGQMASQSSGSESRLACGAFAASRERSGYRVRQRRMIGSTFRPESSSSADCFFDLQHGHFERDCQVACSATASRPQQPWLAARQPAPSRHTHTTSIPRVLLIFPRKKSVFCGTQTSNTRTPSSHSRFFQTLPVPCSISKFLGVP
jgi:hypothetical protein